MARLTMPDPLAARLQGPYPLGPDPRFAYSRMQHGYGQLSYGFGLPGRGPLSPDLRARGLSEAIVRGQPLLGGRALQRQYPYNLDPRLGALNLVPRRDLLLPDPYQEYYNCSCDDCYHRRQHGYPFSLHKHHGCHEHDGCGSSCGSENSNNRTNSDFKMKDVTIRGKAFAVRASYLLEQGKFEKDLVSFMEKKTDAEVPDRVVDMLVSFINRENYDNRDPLDEVTLNVLASNVGAKSVVEYSLSRVKKLEKEITADNIVDIICTIMRSANVGDSLKKWLERFLKAPPHRFREVEALPDYRRKVYKNHPEVHIELEIMLGLRGKLDDDDQRVLS